MCQFDFDPKLTLDGIMGAVFGSMALLVACIALFKEKYSPARLDVYQDTVNSNYEKDIPDNTRVFRTQFHVTNVGDSSAQILKLVCDNLVVYDKQLNVYIENGEVLSTLEPGKTKSYTIVSNIPVEMLDGSCEIFKKPVAISIGSRFRDGRNHTRNQRSTVYLDITDHCSKE